MSIIGRLNIIKMSKLPKATNRFSAIPIKNPYDIFTEMEKNKTFVCNSKRPPVAKSILNKNKVERD